MTDLEKAVSKTAEVVALLMSRGVSPDYVQVLVTKHAERIPEGDASQLVEQLLPTIPEIFRTASKEAGHQPTENVYDRIRQDVREKHQAKENRSTAIERLRGNG